MCEPSRFFYAGFERWSYYKKAQYFLDQNHIQRESRVHHTSMDTAPFLEDIVHFYSDNALHTLAHGEVSSARSTPQEGLNFSRSDVSACALTHKLYLVKIT
jgi:hypothetical protein